MTGGPGRARGKAHAQRDPFTDVLTRLVARSRLLGANERLVVHGGGNTSSKTTGTDHLGRTRVLLLVKASGSDMRDAGPSDFAALYLDELTPLRDREAMTDEEMVAYMSRCLVNPASSRPSIETLLHAFLPAACIDHVHADAICALSNAPDAPRLVAEALGDDVAFVEYVRPGFALSRRVADLAGARAVVLAHHGIVTWGDTDEECSRATGEMVERADAYLATRLGRRPAATVPVLDDAALDSLMLTVRGRLSRDRRKVLRLDTSQRAYAEGPDGAGIAAAGASSADHILRMGIRSVFVDDPAKADAAIDGFELEYRAYFERNREHLPADPDMNEPLPRVFLVPGAGCIAAGEDAKQARVTAEVAARTHDVAATILDAFGPPHVLEEHEIFGIDYWGLQLFKLSLRPAPAELDGRIVVVTGAASGIGRGVALDLGRRGAHLVLADLDLKGLAATAAELPDEKATVVAGDLSDETVVDDVFRSAVRAFGGIDAVVSNAGIPATGALTETSRELWDRSMRVNATSHFVVTQRALTTFARQGIGGSLVYVASKNAFAPGAHFGPYSVAKAAQVQIARMAALEGGPIGVRANIVNPDAVFEGSQLWASGLRADRAAAHGVSEDELEDFYRRRSLLGVRVTPAEVAEAVAFFVSDRSRATTGCVLTVDAGVSGAFPR